MIKSKFRAKPISNFIFLATSTNENSAKTPKFLVQISHFSTYSPNISSNTPSYQSRRQEDESRNVRVSVWWDFENCNVPAGTNVFKVAPAITAAIRANGIKGPIQITAFGDVMQLSRVNQEAFSSTGMNLTHIPRGGKNSADRSLLVDLMYWVSQNPPPAHLFLISGDRDFAGILHRLRMNNYNILLASSHGASSVLCSAASIMWHWNSLLKGEDVSGKHFNQPPDGPYGSWYGHYKAPLEDPFAVTEQTAFPQPPEQSACPPAEVLPDSNSENRTQPIPKAVIKQIRSILHQNPKGISITELRAELSKSSITVDKDFYGYRKFSRFLLALPHILRLQPRNDGQFFVFGIAPKVSEQADLSPSPSITTRPIHKGEVDSVAAGKLSAGKGPCNDQLVGKQSIPASSEAPMKNGGQQQEPLTEFQKPIRTLPVPPLNEPELKSASVTPEDATTEVQEQPREVQESSALVQAADNTKATESQLHLVVHRPESELKNKLGFFRRICRIWYGPSYDSPDEKLSSTSDGILDEKKKAKGEHVQSRVESVESVCPDSLATTRIETIPDGNISSSSSPTNDRSRKSSGFFGQLLSMLRIWENSEQPDDSGGESSEKMNDTKLACNKNGIFVKESFWDDLKTFLGTGNASAIVLQSKTRVQMGQNLQREGPSLLKSLNESDLLHLVDLLISDKKWIEESPCQNYPFKLINSDEKDLSSQSTNVSRQSNGLSSIFSDTQPSSLSQRPREIDRQKRHQNPPHTGVSQPDIEGMLSGKSRTEILADCEKLLDEIVKKYPEGFNIGSFRKVFFERYSYPLDVQKLGYQKLATLLQIMPGVRIESTYILPTTEVLKSLSPDNMDPFVQRSNFGSREGHSETELSDSSGKEDDTDSSWDELGPVANLGSKRNESGPALSRKVKDETVEKIRHDYESLSDDDFSDSEEEPLSSTKSESQKKQTGNEEDSSLLQILDSWYSSKEENTKRGTLEYPEAGADSSGNSSWVSTKAASTAKNEPSVVKNAKKQRSLKAYSFVQDQAVENKDKLVDGILGSLKKSDEKSAETRI
ncbi:uncharacterized protein [Coffea arabica]|uniref:HTH OST-type domain-containing protein n=1 Tax=Coffea arabica TaxID=13443 RepID=A0A6P6TMZ3_COFAR|nr:uncharacterized protein LOC113702394 [Coffea arabica]